LEQHLFHLAADYLAEIVTQFFFFRGADQPLSLELVTIVGVLGDTDRSATPSVDGHEPHNRRVPPPSRTESRFDFNPLLDLGPMALQLQAMGGHEDW